MWSICVDKWRLCKICKIIYFFKSNWYIRIEIVGYGKFGFGFIFKMEKVKYNV